MSGRTTSMEGSVKFVCDKNYTLVGSDVLFCRAKGVGIPLFHVT